MATARSLRTAGVTVAALVAGLIVGAGVVLLADPGDDGAGAVAPAPVAAAPSGGHVHAGPDAGVRGVKAIDIAAELEPDQPLDAATRDALGGELVAARALAERYPTVADALAAGYRLAGGFAPGSGAHYVAISAAGLSGAGPVEPDRVNSLIYDGTSPTSRIAGLMYYAMSTQAPEGFAGPNDHWHRHSSVCIKMTPQGIEVPFPADADVSAAQCREARGSMIRQTGWMVHAWVVPGWESPKGVFSHDNPNLRCADGTMNTDDAGFCTGT